MPKGRKSIKQVLSDLGFNPDKIFEGLKGCKTVKVMEEKYNQLTNNKASCHPQTIIRTLKKEGASEEDYPFLKANRTRKRGKTSVRELLEQHFGKPLWDTIKEECTPGACLEAVAAKIEGLSEITVKPQTLLNTVQRGIETGEVKEEDWFHKWIKEKKHRTQRENLGKPSNFKAYRLKYTCRECGHSLVDVAKDEGCLGDEINLNLIARRCRRCNKWKTYLVEGEIQGTNIRKAVVSLNEYGYEWDGETFVDKNFKIIDNPLPEETQESLRQCSADLEKRQARDRKTRDSAAIAHHHTITEDED